VCLYGLLPFFFFTVTYTRALIRWGFINQSCDTKLNLSLTWWARQEQPLFRTRPKDPLPSHRARIHCLSISQRDAHFRRLHARRWWPARPRRSLHIFHMQNPTTCYQYSSQSRASGQAIDAPRPRKHKEQQEQTFPERPQTRGRAQRESPGRPKLVGRQVQCGCPRQ